jgi:predicted RNA binding protein YcfA (HicA-like mRNA interferase family)
MAASRDIIRLLERDGWVLGRVKGSHHVFAIRGSGGE